MRLLLSVALLLAAALSFASAERQYDPRPSVDNTTELYHTQFIDHFGWRNETFLQRYFVYDKWFKPGGPMFFYTGNEADVVLFVNSTGLMWQNGEELNALLVFAEHRFFGRSLPCPGGFMQCGNYLGTEQAMTDYAVLIEHLQTQKYLGVSAVVTFGGSYGGMLSAWMRMRYPNIVTGAIASSAPIGCMSEHYSGESYWAVVTRDATSAGGAEPNCAQNVNAAITEALAMFSDPSDLSELTDIFNLCSPLRSTDQEAFGLFIQAAFDSMAMGNYPFPSSYISGAPGFPAPAWPMRVACQAIGTAASTRRGLLTQLWQAISVVDNITGIEVPCYNISGLNPSVYSAIWDYMVCTEGMINEQPYFAATGWPADMFWKQPVYNRARMNQHCQHFFGKTPRWNYLNDVLGVKAIPSSSNIVFANGLLDPWHSGGILTNLSSTLLAFHIPDGGHHLDLFFSTDQDPDSVKWVRRRQVENIRRWMS